MDRSSTLPEALAPEFGRAEIVKLTLRLREPEADALILNATGLGLSYGEYVARLVRQTPLPMPAAERAADRATLMASTPATTWRHSRCALAVAKRRITAKNRHEETCQTSARRCQSGRGISVRPRLQMRSPAHARNWSVSALLCWSELSPLANGGRQPDGCSAVSGIVRGRATVSICRPEADTRRPSEKTPSSRSHRCRAMKDCVRTGRRAVVRPRPLIIPISMLKVEPWSFAALLNSAQPGEYAQCVSIIQRAQAGQAIAN
jgi:hypothetical protein